MYNFKKIESEIQKKWNFNTKINSNKPKYYVLEMFPYPSGNIHMGHLRNYAIGDVIARYKRACNYNVLHPIGWDAFGLPAENAALQNNCHPAEWTQKNISSMKEQLKSIGLSYDWSRELITCDPEYFKHEQQFFIDFFNKGLAYRKEAYVNWDPVDKTVLANEQVINGRGWRSGAKVEHKKLSQWFLKTTEFASELLDELKGLDRWPDKVLTMQENWIGKSTGAEIEFDIIGTEKKLKVFSTRPETIFGASFCAIATNHPITNLLKDKKIDIFINENSAIKNESIDTAEKKGIDTGLRVQHPFLADKQLPIYIANFVLMDYGTGAIFGCPAHDKRDCEFAEKYNLPIYPVITSDNSNDKKNNTLYNSDFLNGLNESDAKELAINRLTEKKIGKRVVNYRLRDWGVSRQRYWGCPIPIIYCKNCGAVPAEDLPVKLPSDIDFTKKGNPLDNHSTWKYVKCPLCNTDATRETDTFDTFFESSWYFVAFCGLEKKHIDAFLPVDCYIGGIEHAVLHLLYARFFTKVLQKCGYISSTEPFAKLITQGMICHKTYQNNSGDFLFPTEALRLIEKGEEVSIGPMEKMSKSKKNVINPNVIIDQYGADTARLFMLSDIPPERDLEWSEKGLKGAWKFINRIYNMIEQYDRSKIYQPSKKTQQALHQCLNKLTDDMEQNRLNCAVARLHEMTNLLYDDDQILSEGIPILVRCIEPFTPHLAEYLWSSIGNSNLLCNTEWPKADEKLLIEDTITVAVQINGKLQKTIDLAPNSTEEEYKNSAKSAVDKKLENKQIKKIIVVPNKIVNFVI